MDQFLRVVAVLLEVSVLGIMSLCLFWGVKLLLDDSTQSYLRFAPFEDGHVPERGSPPGMSF